MKISIVTFTLGSRDHYLDQCIRSVLFQEDAPKYEHHIIFQGAKNNFHISKTRFMEEHGCVFHEWPENIGIGAGLNKILPECSGELILKMDDDCRLITQSLLSQAYDIYKRFPNSVFSPYPVGLIRNPGGPPGSRYSIWHKKESDVFYTRRHVSHVGGFARFSPASIIKNFKFAADLSAGQSGTEDGQFSEHCRSNGVDMFYLENELIVEHNESGLGQIARYKDYFASRSWESSVKLDILE